MTNEVTTTTTTAAAVFDATCLAGQLAPSSAAMYERDARAYVIFCEGAGLDALAATSLVAWRNDMAQATTLSPNTINRQVSAVKRFVVAAAERGYCASEIAAQFRNVRGVQVKALKNRVRTTARTRISAADMRRVCEAPNTASLVGVRDRALLATLASSGCRVSEIAELTITQIVKENGGYKLYVLGKNDVTPREAPLSPEAYNLVMAWIDRRPILCQHVFTSFAGRGAARMTTKPMTPEAVEQLVSKYAVSVGLAHVTPHTFRRFVGTQLAKTDIRKAQRALGHKRIDTTARHYVLDTLEVGLTDHLY